MDLRWQPSNSNELKDYTVVLHPRADVRTVRLGQADDDFDLSPFLSSGSHGVFDCNLTLDWNHELLGANQPAPGMVLEVRCQAAPLWIGIIDALSSYLVAVGQRQMQVTARSRDSLDIWRTSKRVTPLYPQMTNLAVIARDICAAVGLQYDEVLLPQSPYYTAHSNTQMANQTAWDMEQTLLLPMGLTPFVDCLGRFRGASRDIKGVDADIVLTDDRVVKVTASRAKVPTTRVILYWLDPNLTKATQQGRKLGETTITVGFFLPFIRRTLYWSQDRTQRAENTYLRIISSCNKIGVPVALQNYSQNDEVSGEIELISLGWTQAILFLGLWQAAAEAYPDVVPSLPPTFTVPIGKIKHGRIELALFLTTIAMGTGIYEIWGTPYDWIHARNLTEAYDSSGVAWMDNPQQINNDFIVNEAHADAVAVRELIYQNRAAQKWTATIVEDRRIEFGTRLQFPDGSKMYVEDFGRSLAHGGENVLEVTGFLC